MHRNHPGFPGRRSAFFLACIMLVVVGGASSAIAQQSSLPRPEDYKTNRFDSSDTLKVTGPILQVDTTDSGSIIWMRATTVTRQGFGSRPGSNEADGVGIIWRVEGRGVDKFKDLAKLTPDTEIVVTGDNLVDKTCEPTCRIRSDRVVLK